MRYFGSRVFFLPLSVLLLFAAGVQLSCRAYSREENIREFLQCLKENDQQKIYDISYHDDTRNGITDNDVRKGRVSSASRAIKKYGLSPQSKWHTEQIYGGSSELSIPLFAGNDTTVRYTIFLYFPPPAVSNKVFNFDVNSGMERNNSPLLAPSRVN